MKKMPAAQRREVERLLVKGMSGKSIAKKLGLPLNTWVSAVKKNPIPGGLLDPKGRIAKYEGEWIDLDGVVREYKGLDSKGNPKPGLPIIRKRGRRPNAQTQKTQVQEVDGAARDRKDKGAILPFADRARLNSAKQVSGTGLDSAPTATEGGVPDAPPAILMPDAQHVGSKERDDEAAIPDDAPKQRRAKKGLVAKLAQKKYPISKRLDDLLAIKDEAMKATASTAASKLSLDDTLKAMKVALDVIKTLNDMDGTSAAAKKDDQGPPSNAPLFAMPKGTSQSVAVGVAPVGPVPLRLDNEEDAPVSDTAATEDD